MKVEEKMRGLIAQLCRGLYEREEVVKLALLSAIAGESIFLLGPPGVGKSLIARRLKYAFKDARSFEYLMTRFSTPEEVFGPISIKKLKEEDKYERQTERYMPGAKLVFLDEIWKASSSIQNALLTIINEKVYRNGEQEVDVELHALITASNELPPEGENFGPLYDRLLLRYHLLPIKSRKSFLDMITSTTEVYEDDVEEQFKIEEGELQQWDAEINRIVIADEVLKVIEVLRLKMEEYNHKQERPELRFQVYDRRWKKLIRLLRTSAFLNGRDRVDLMDCFLLIHGLWNSPQQTEAVREMVSESIRKHGYSVKVGLAMLRREIEEFAEEVESETRIKHLEEEEVLRPIDEEYYALKRNGEAFSGKHLAVKDYNKLKRDQREVVNLYDDEFKLVNRLEAEKTDTQFELRLKHNSQLHTLRLETYKREKTRFLFKTPHPLVKSFWEERYEKIDQYLQEQQSYLEAQKPADLKGGNQHLFVDESLFEIVSANHKAVQEELKDLKLRLDKSRHAYQRSEN